MFFLPFGIFFFFACFFSLFTFADSWLAVFLPDRFLLSFVLFNFAFFFFFFTTL
ncbi:hypothetical protein EX30DRAFT_246904 [Ascodesmis nigricans]|uniref:Uncharacterized protein n=1 Tax=Ascodesmis nigricans TaxID=341454 RepID=A0A4S2MMS5_9PEZI|nr:hypothetical protein EX30DRAFT_246904 [Ascodesmis nigricans]